MSVFMLCERAIGLVRGNRLALDGGGRALLESLNYEGLLAGFAQEEAVTCARHFESVRDGLFEYPWVFAKKAALLTSPVAAAGGFRLAWSLPQDCFKVDKLVEPRGTTPDYTQFGGVVACNSENVTAYYTARVTDTRLWPPAFQETFIARLAHQIAFAVTGSLDAVAGAERLFQFALTEAYRVRAIDGTFSADNWMAQATPATKHLVSPTPEFAESNHKGRN